jgi:hypothetical protein
MLPDAKLSNYMRALLHPCLYTLLTLKTATLVDLQDLLQGKNEYLIERALQSSIPTFQKFFKEEFFHKDYTRTKQSLYTKIQSLLNSQVFYHMTIGDSTINLEQCRRNHKIVLFNLSKGKLGEEASEAI